MNGQTDRIRGAPFMSWFFAFLHHIAAFTVVAALVVETVLLNGDLTLGLGQGLSRG